MSYAEMMTEDPIDDVPTALDLLLRRWNDNTTRKLLSRRRDVDTGPSIEIGYHHDFVDSTRRTFMVTERVERALVAAGYVRGTPHWGYTDDHERTLTEAGEARIWELRKEVGLDDRLTAARWIVEHA